MEFTGLRQYLSIQYNCYFRFGACVGVVFTAAILCFMNSYDAEFVFDDSEAIINNQVQIHLIFNVYSAARLARSARK